MNRNIRILSQEVLADIRSAAWLESELHPELDLHRRHEMADICEKDNIERVWRIAGLSVAEIRFALDRILEQPADSGGINLLEQPEHWDFLFRRKPGGASADYLKEKIHEYIVARVMADRTSAIMPDSSSAWRLRANNALSDISSTAGSSASLAGRARRPLWPM